MAYDPWPELDSDPIMLMIDNNKLVLEKVLALVKEPDMNTRQRAFYAYVTQTAAADLTLSGDRDSAKVLRTEISNLHKHPLLYEMGYWIELCTHYTNLK